MKVFARDLWLQSSKLLVYIGLIFKYPLSDTGFASKESSSKALVVNDDSKEESDDDDYDEEDDELSPKLGHFKLECPDLEKLKDKKKKFFKPKKTSLMSTWEDLDNSSSDEDGEEEANLCLMANAFTSKADPALDVSLDDEDSQPDDIANSDGEEEVKALLDEKVSSGCKSLRKDFQDLEEKVKSLTTTLEDSEEWHKEMLKQKLLLQKECTFANDELDNLKKKDSDLWMECQHDKKMAFDLNCKLKGHEVLKELPP
ncbi:hypothetical protein JHK84_044898 [Glycine max]|nr:hypothetical protein JHK85_045404 [Glycine max]KAG5107991.1 hypothetical protein JHK84_044898 [Glycine max]